MLSCHLQDNHSYLLIPNGSIKKAKIFNPYIRTRKCKWLHQMHFYEKGISGDILISTFCGPLIHCAYWCKISLYKVKLSCIWHISNFLKPVPVYVFNLWKRFLVADRIFTARLTLSLFNEDKTLKWFNLQKSHCRQTYTTCPFPTIFDRNVRPDKLEW